MEIAVRLSGVAKRFGEVVAVQPLDLTIERGDFLAILGPSGCGKTTLLRMIGGFTLPSAGRIEVNGRDVTRLGPDKRPTNMVFQGYGLFPHMNLRQNIAYGLKLKKLPAAEIDRRVAAAIALVRLDEQANRTVTELSGGQQQRVALARALVMEPEVLLLDEPLAALDLKLRQAMQEELRRIHRTVGGTFVFVTHDQGEALALANRIAVMNAGRVEQIGTPEEIYSAPASRFVATFIGEANLLAGERCGDTLTTRCGIVCSAPGPDGPALLIVRPESVRRLGSQDTADVMVGGRVEEAVFLGGHVRYTLALPSAERIVLHDAIDAERAAIGSDMLAGWNRRAQRVIRDSG
ncbi:MAG: ABC transporter ATP-binding protein [Pseudomonadota bacterium]|nr:ABC transporter ATP-binding protein [Pseudomonadota bacterium]